MNVQLGWIDSGILLIYGAILVWMGIYFLKKSRTSEQFMVAGRGIPAWAAGLAVMSAYTSSISYIATPGKSFDANWHPLIFALVIIPVVWFVCRFVVPYYRKANIISVYGYLEDKLGSWARIYAALSFVLYMIGRVAVILYLVGLLLSTFVPWSIVTVIIVISIITIIYTLLGGMEAVIWTDVMQSAIMIVGILFCAIMLTMKVFSGSPPPILEAWDAGKFSMGSLKLSLTSRTVWVMIIYGVTENLRNLLADQNYVQKYVSVSDEKQAKRSIWIAMMIYIPLTFVFLYIGTTLYAYYSAGTGNVLPPEITKGDQVFPYFIATQVPVFLKGLIIAAIVAAAMSTVDSALNCSATVLLLDFYRRFVNPKASEKTSLLFLRGVTVVWGVGGAGFAILMIKAKSALDIWWQISGVFGGGILGLFLLSLMGVRLRLWQGLVAVGVSIALISWGTFDQLLPEGLRWNIDKIIIGAIGTAALMLVAILLSLMNPRQPEPSVNR